MTRLDDSPVPDYANRLRLDDRRFVVIGAGQGIGRQTAHALAANGARLLCVDVDAGLAEDIAGEVGGTPWSGDATQRADVERMFDDAVDVLNVKRAFEKAHLTNPIFVATNGGEALEMLKTGRIPERRVVLLDLAMPRIDGVELLGDVTDHAGGANPYYEAAKK